jgi:hypothetical protein
MYMTEEEAKNKICPNGFADDIQKFEYCVATGCMAWRWSGSSSAYEDLPSLSHPVTGERKRFKPPSTIANEPKKGYCGLAGKVE